MGRSQVIGDNLIIISGCSGGGKSTLLDALAARGCAVVLEHGRRLLQLDRAAGGAALPWDDKIGFIRRMIDQAMRDHADALHREGVVFFDRSLIDAASALEHLTGEPVLEALAPRYRYATRVFMAPPWPDIYVTDEDRRHDFAAAAREYDRLARDYPRLGYVLCTLPRVSVAARADFILAQLNR